MHSMSGIRWVLTGAATLAILVAAPAGQTQVTCQYEVTIIQQEDCSLGAAPTTGTGVSEAGDVVGYFRCPGEEDQAFLWTPEDGLITLDMPPGTFWSRAYDISGDRIVGVFDVSGDGLGNLGFLYDYETGEFRNLGTLPGHNWSEAYAIGEQHGQIIGFSVNSTTGPFRAVIWHEDGEITDLGGTIGGLGSRALDITDELPIQVVGSKQVTSGGDQVGFLWEGGVLTELPFPGAISSTAAAIGKDRAVAGWGILPNPDGDGTITRAFLWDEGQMIDLGTLANHLRSAALDIRSGPLQVVGQSWNVDGNPNISDGFIWQDGVMTDLNKLIPRYLGLDIRSASAINELGQITATASAPEGTVAVLLTPMAPLGDLSGDCRVGILDLLRLLAAWGPCRPRADCPADLNNDGTVNVFDLVLLLVNWG